MKRGTKCVLPISVGIDLDRVERIKFVFAQNTKRLLFEYPSERAKRKDDVICLVWEQEETFSFEAGKVRLDTFINLKDAETNPRTEIIELNMFQTLFHLEEIGDD